MVKEAGPLIAFATGPAHAVYFGTYELVKEFAGGNVDAGHHPIAAGRFLFSCAQAVSKLTKSMKLQAERQLPLPVML